LNEGLKSTLKSTLMIGDLREFMANSTTIALSIVSCMINRNHSSRKSVLNYVPQIIFYKLQKVFYSVKFMFMKKLEFVGLAGVVTN
jgi:hypothetical protein